MTIPSTPSYAQIPNTVNDLLKNYKGYQGKLTKSVLDVKNTTRFVSKRLKVVDQLQKQLKENVKLTKQFKEVAENLKAGKFKKVNPGLGRAVGFALQLASIGLHFMTINQIGQLQETQLKIDGIQSRDLSNSFTQSINNALNLKKLREDLQKFINEYKGEKDKLFAEAYSSRQSALEARVNSEDAKKQANDALYEARVGRQKVEAKISQISNYLNNLSTNISNNYNYIYARISDARNIANDALYETRVGRQKIEQKIAILNAKVSQFGTALALATGTTNQFLIVKQLANQAISIAKSANSKANQALKTKAQPGRDGKPGINGKDGKPGINGRNGIDGKNGLNGRPGINGKDGKPGINGRNGIDGKNGLNGRPGINGKDGKPGLNGRNGIDGKNGLNGKDGKDGKDGQDVDQNQYNNLLQQIAVIPALIARVPGKTIQGMPKPLTGQQIEAAASAGVCRSTRAGGCMSNALNNNSNNLANQINGNTNKWGQNLLNKFNAGANTVQLGLLQKIDLKMGPQVAGGLSGAVGKNFEKLNKFARWLKLDRMLNVLTWMNTLHNAHMLSSNLTSTLFSIIDNLGNTFFKDDEGESFDTRSLLGKAFDDFAKGLFGVKAWNETKRTYKKYMRVYQAAVNMMGMVTSMFQSTYNIFNVIGNRMSNIGNALRWYGVVSEKAYSWMNPLNKFQNKIITKLTELNEAGDFLDQISSDVLNVKEQSASLGKETVEFEKAVADLNKKENQKEKLQSQAIKAPGVIDQDITV
ncbi:MAG: hypothetical protein AAF378_08265 [Cyanobacteria bacterium P01_A01_bin.84]